MFSYSQIICLSKCLNTILHQTTLLSDLGTNRSMSLYSSIKMAGYVLESVSNKDCDFSLRLHVEAGSMIHSLKSASGILSPG